jgi:thioredoxin 1
LAFFCWGKVSVWIQRLDNKKFYKLKVLKSVMAGNTVELDAENFDKFVKEDKVVVDFWAEWCGPCKIMGPIFKDAAREMKDKAKFGKVDVDANQDLAQRFEVMSIPTMIFFRDGEQVERVVGVLSKEELIEKLQEIK